MTSAAPIDTLPLPHLPVERWQLSNGLRVIVQVDARCPLVAVVMCYEAGSRHDPPSRAGLAHCCEHLAFDGPAGEGATSLARVSGTARAVTTQDRVCFSMLVPSDALEDALTIEAERMRQPPAPQDDEAFEVQRRVLIRELGERSQTRLRAVAFEHLHRLIFSESHTYHRPPAGEPDGIRAITAADVRGFAADRFSPQNARLVLVGDVSVSAAAALATKIFGAVRAGAKAARAVEAATPLMSEHRSRRVPAPVVNAQTFLAWPIAGFAQDDWYLASLLVRGAATGRSSPLAEALVDRMRLAGDVQGYLVSMREASTLVLAATAARGVSSDRLEQGLVEATDALTDGLDERAHARARRKALVDHYFVLQDLELRADRCGSLDATIGAPGSLELDVERYRQPDRRAVARFASTLTSAPHAMVSLVPAAEAV